MFGNVSFAGMLFNTIFFNMKRDHENIFQICKHTFFNVILM